jgi:hypothetical protein
MTDNHLKPVLWISLIVLVLGLIVVEQATALIGLPFTPLSFAGVARRTTFRVAAVDTAAMAGAATASSAAAASDAAAHPAPTPLPDQSIGSPMPTTGPPIGTTVATLPSGCAATPVNNIEYHDCGGVYYRPAFQGNNLVYVVVQKP